jgi:hypothetical protein
MYLGAKFFGSGEHGQKAAIVLDVDRYRYQKFISDIAGQDIRSHGGSTDEAIRQVREFLSTHARAGVFLPGGDTMVERYSRFRRALPGMCAKLHLNSSKLNFRDLTGLIVTWLDEHPLAPATPAG